MTNRYHPGGQLRRAGLIIFLLFFVGSNTTADTGFDLREFRGKVVVLDFWASWCVPCRRSFPWLNNMQEKFADEGRPTGFRLISTPQVRMNKNTLLNQN